MTLKEVLQGDDKEIAELYVNIHCKDIYNESDIINGEIIKFLYKHDANYIYIGYDKNTKYIFIDYLKFKKIYSGNRRINH